MATYDRTAADALLKKRYEGPVRNQINTASKFISQLERDSDSAGFDGLEVVLPLWVTRAEGHGATSDGGVIPTARNPEHTQSRFSVKYLAGRIELSVAAMKTMSTNAGSFVRTLDSLTKNITQSFKEDRARQVVANDINGSGALVSCGTTSSSTTVTLATSATVATARMLRAGMYIDIIDSDDDSVLASERKISSVTLNSSGVPTAIVITGAPVTTDSTHRICRTGSWEKELVGLEGIVDDAGTLQNVNPSTYDSWKAQVLGNSGTSRPWSEDLTRQLLDELDIEGDGEDVLLLMEHTQRRKIEAQLKAQRRVVNSLDLKGGVKAITFDDRIPIVVDKFVNPTKIFALNTSHLKFYSAADFEWMKDDGAILNRVPNKLAYEATFYCFEELATDRRNAHGVIEDLATT